MNLTPEQSTNIMNLVLKLSGLGIKATFSHLENGPVVTGYYFTPDVGTSVKKLTSRSEDFAVGIGADKVDVQRIGGHVVVFVPNKERKIIDFKENLHWYLHDETVRKMELPIPVGMDHKGRKSSFDLVDMPHMLIAGSTGSGKSVFEAAIICSLAYHKSSDDLELYLVDTKKVDLPLFKDLPHVKQVADDLATFHSMMLHIMGETRRRLNILQGAGVRKLQDFNKGNFGHMPYMVVMMDEFGDLIGLDSAARKAEQYEDMPTVKQWIQSLVQIGRAAGVHLIACTQRSSVKVVDGDIKANLPCRIALRLPTGIDSRTILGCNGAENLLGKGDMLIQRPESDVVERFHGPFVSMQDIGELVYQYDMIKTMFTK